MTFTEPSEQQIIQTLTHLFGRAQEHMQEPFEGLEDDEQACSRPLNLQLPTIPKIVAKISPEDIAEIKRELEGKRGQADDEEDGDEHA